MATQLDICNSALIKLGAEPIVALTDNTKRAKLCAQQYSKSKRKMLYNDPWNFAIQREELTANGEIPVFGFDNKFDLPTDYLRILELEVVSKEWQMEGETILANDDTIRVRYIAEVDEDIFSPSFEEALALDIAYDLSYALVQDKAYRSQLQQEKEFALAQARSFNAQEGTAPQLTDDSFLVSRDHFSSDIPFVNDIP